MARPVKKVPRRSGASTATSTPKTPNPPVTPTQTQVAAPAEDIDWNNLPGEIAFTVKYHPKSNPKPAVTKKRKRPSKADETEPATQENPFTDYLDTVYSVTPGTLWSSARRYRKFTIRDSLFDVGDVVLVHNDDPLNKPEKVDLDDPDLPPPVRLQPSPLSEELTTSWVGKVLEVRAGDEQHVFLRVYWLYRPEDLPFGRKWYHGERELIASNDMQIIDAMTVNSKVNLQHWDENNDDDDPNPDNFFWRQTWDLRKQELSQLRKHCICEEAANPDRLLINCESCHKWLHQECIIDAAEKEAKANSPDSEEDTIAAEPAPQASGTKSNRRRSNTKAKRKSKVDKELEEHVNDVYDEVVAVDGKGKGKEKEAVKSSGKSQWKAEINQVDSKKGKDGDKKYEIVLVETTADGEKNETTKEVKCLNCQKVID